MPDILIGNIRGPQGETGPANQPLATVYEFCQSDLSAGVPEGPWVSRLEEIEQGKMYWCRSVTTYEYGQDIQVVAAGYIGRDGEFNGIELVNELSTKIDALESRTTPISKGGTEATTLEGAQAKLGIKALREELTERLDKINDYTTGINLVRGSRDFRTGVEKNSVLSDYFNDGFNNRYPKYYTWYKDDEGFTVLNGKKVGESGGSHSFQANLIPVEAGKIYTISFDVQIETDSSDHNPYIFAYAFYDKNGSRLKSFDGRIKDTNAKDFQVGKWHTVVHKATAGAGAKYLAVNLYIVNEGSNLYKKVSVYEGSINNPIWSPSPFDIDRINDITTGVNLIRGSRDFIIGINGLQSAGGRFTDGFDNRSNFVISKDEQGFAVATKSGSGSSGIYTPLVEAEPYIGKILTLSVEVMLKDSSTLIKTENCALLGYYNESGTFTAPTFKSLNEAFSYNMRDNEWVVVTLTMTVPSNAKYIMGGGVKYAGSGSVSFRKFCLYEGHIEHPEWSASPFDVAQANSVHRPESTAYVADLNKVEDGFHNWNQSTLNTPGSNYGTVHQWSNGNKSSNVWIFQLGMTTSNPPIMVFRSSINNAAWSPWQRVTATEFPAPTT